MVIAHYRITANIGEGCMGEVYLADDTSLGRKVALKCLSAALRQDPIAHNRFLREARSAAALDHPYICSIHEVAEAEGTDYIVMEYVQGQTLRDKLETGHLPRKGAVWIAVEVCEALELAHGQGAFKNRCCACSTPLSRIRNSNYMKRVTASGSRTRRSGTSSRFWTSISAWRNEL